MNLEKPGKDDLPFSFGVYAFHTGVPCNPMLDDHYQCTCMYNGFSWSDTSWKKGWKIEHRFVNSIRAAVRTGIWDGYIGTYEYEVGTPDECYVDMFLDDDGYFVMYSRHILPGYTGKIRVDQGYVESFLDLINPEE